MEDLPEVHRSHLYKLMSVRGRVSDSRNKEETSKCVIMLENKAFPKYGSLLIDYCGIFFFIVQPLSAPTMVSRVSQ